MGSILKCIFGEDGILNETLLISSNCLARETRWPQRLASTVFVAQSLWWPWSCSDGLHGGPWCAMMLSLLFTLSGDSSLQLGLADVEVYILHCWHLPHHLEQVRAYMLEVNDFNTPKVEAVRFWASQYDLKRERDGAYQSFFLKFCLVTFRKFWG